MFHTKLQVELQDDGSTWKTLQDLVYEDEMEGFIGVPEAYLTDFASVPRIPVVFDLVGDYGHAAATVHDYLYDHGKITRKEIDKVFHRALLDTGVGKFRSYIMYKGVRLFGFIAFRNARKGK
ncbi:tail assembly chaperone [Xanthomonas phage XaC1]|nr:tail assembly chaperone [Xanthomonas phage XaC1]